MVLETLNLAHNVFSGFLLANLTRVCFEPFVFF
jgi:hypothetical protein